mmetsp:Transcript_4466/g.9055  ORF Transcript_4466/g.9055 Transcript_4466/m.9055 type:complete len:223 (-) Transcript_4466:350-1018(-)
MHMARFGVASQSSASPPSAAPTPSFSPSKMSPSSMSSASSSSSCEASLCGSVTAFFALSSISRGLAGNLLTTRLFFGCASSQEPCAVMSARLPACGAAAARAPANRRSTSRWRRSYESTEARCHGNASTSSEFASSFDEIRNQGGNSGSSSSSSSSARSSGAGPNLSVNGSCGHTQPQAGACAAAALRRTRAPASISASPPSGSTWIMTLSSGGGSWAGGVM